MSEDLKTEAAMKKAEADRRRVKVSDPYVFFDSMTWPYPGERLAELERKLRQQPAELSASDRLLAASVVAAFFQLVENDESQNEIVLENLRYAHRSCGSQKLH